MTETETVQEGGDDLRAAIEKDFETLSQEPVEAVETVEPVDTGKARDDKGRFAKKEAEIEAVEPAIEQEETPKQPESRIEPPVHWGGAAKTRWEKLPVRVQEEISKDYAEQAKKSQGYAPLEQVLAPHRQKLSMRYGDEVRGVQTLLAYADSLEKDPVGTLQYIARERGIDLSQLVPQQGQQFADPQSALHQEIHHLKQQIANITQNFESGNTSKLQADIDAFARDPKHPYFQDVKPVMGALIQAAHVRGQQMTLDQAYEQAVYVDPRIRAEILEQQKQAELASKQQKLQSAKAAQPIKGAPGTSGAVNGNPPTTIRGAIEEAWSALA